MMCLPEGTDKNKVISDLMQACTVHPSVQLLMKGRANLGLSPDDWMEDKHPGGTVACNLKTRMNWIGNDKETVHQAKVGFAKDRDNPAYIEFEALETIARERQQAYYNETRPNRISDVMEGRAKDVTFYLTSNHVNVAPDWKRHFRPDGTSTPFTTTDEYWKYRRAVDALDYQAWPDAVEYLLKHGRGNSPHAFTNAIRRDVYHRIALGVTGYRLPRGMTFKGACQRLGIHEKALTRLRKERRTLGDIPLGVREVHDIQKQLGLW
jgi:hypothetical protein